MLIIYRILINITIILSPVILLIRLLNKKEHPKRFKEKFCVFSKERKKGKLLWFHGASVGELLSIIPLVEKLEKKKEIKQILITTSTLSSAKIFLKFKLKKTIHQFFPIDSNYFSNKFLNFWKPDLAIFIDSEIWPNMIFNLKKKSIKCILLNARLSKKSFRRWQLLPRFAKKIFSSFDYVYPQTDETRSYLKNLGCKKITKIGNLKFIENKTKISIKSKNKVGQFVKREIWCGSSTHNLEELFCAKAHIELKKKYKNLLTIIIPRHVNRIYEIEQNLKEKGLNVHIHSTNKKINKSTDIYLVDTYGETESFFKISKIVFLGGSLVNHGGQNPLEAARFGCKIIHGDNVFNFKEIYSLLKKNSQSFKVKNSDQLSKTINYLFKTKNNSNNLSKKIRKMGVQILKKTENEVSKLLR